MNSTNSKNRLDYISYGYGLLILVGGAIGFIKAGSFLKIHFFLNQNGAKNVNQKTKGSMFSLVAGMLFGLASIVGAFQLSNDAKNFHLALITASVLLAVMGFRFYSSGKFMPAGFIASLSMLQVVRLGVRFTEKEKQQID